MKNSDNERIVKLEDGTEVYIKDPTTGDYRASEAIWNDVFNKELKKGHSMLQEELDKFLREKGLWDDKKQAEYVKIDKELESCIKELAGGGNINKAKELAIKIRGLRIQRRFLLQDRAKFNSSTIEGQADNARFNFLLAKCAVYNNDRDKTYFKNYEDYLNRADDNGAYEIASCFAKVYYGTLGLDKDQPENKFLQRFNFVNEDLRLVNDEGHLVNADGHLIDEFGRLIAYSSDDVAYYVDTEGNKVDERGNPLFDDVVFTDDDGNPINTSNGEVKTKVKSKTKSKTEASVKTAKE